MAEMLRVSGLWEVVLAVGILLLSSGEFIGLWMARRAGLTRNYSRLATHGLLALVSAFYAIQAVSWSRGLEGPDSIVLGSQYPVANWGFLLLAALIGIVAYELASHLWAMQLGLTKSVPRLVTHLAMALLLILMIMINLTRWQLYLGMLEDSYRQNVESSADQAP